MSPSNWLAPRALAQLATRLATRDQPPRQALIIPFHDAEPSVANSSPLSANSHGPTLPQAGDQHRSESP